MLIINKRPLLADTWEGPESDLRGFTVLLLSIQSGVRFIEVVNDKN